MDELTRTWSEIATALPDGWSLDSLRCASTSLAVNERSEDWIAVGVRRDGLEVQARAGDPLAALQALPAAVRDAA